MSEYATASAAVEAAATTEVVEATEAPVAEEYIPSKEELFLKRVAHGMPKTALHVHIEGSLEAEMAFELATKYGALPLKIPKGDGFVEVSTLEELQTVYRFEDLLSFLNIYSTLSAECLREKEDFAQLAEAYCRHALADNVLHAEVFFDPQTHTARGIPFETVADGLNEGFDRLRHKMSVRLIACILRDHSVGHESDPLGLMWAAGVEPIATKPDDVITEDTADVKETETTAAVEAVITEATAVEAVTEATAVSAAATEEVAIDETKQEYERDPTSWTTLAQVHAYNQAIADGRKEAPANWAIIGLGMDNCEVGFAPQKFKALYNKAVDDFGLLPFAHAGEEGPASYVWQALDDLGVVRIDHGVRCIEDPHLCARLAVPRMDEAMTKHFGGFAVRVALTCCPRSNYKLCVFKDPRDNNLLRLLDLGLCVTVNSDDPAYFGGYANAQFDLLIDAFNGRFVEDGISLPTEKPAGFYRQITLADLRQLCWNGIEASVMPNDAKAKLYKKAQQFFFSTAGVTSAVGKQFYTALSGKPFPEPPKPKPKGVSQFFCHMCALKFSSRGPTHSSCVHCKAPHFGRGPLALACSRPMCSRPPAKCFKCDGFLGRAKKYEVRMCNMCSVMKSKKCVKCNWAI